MRGLRSTVALLVVGLGLGAYIYFVTSKQPETTDPASKREKVFVGVDAERVGEIQITSTSGDHTTVKKENGTWQVTAPLTTKGDENAIIGVTRNIATLELTRVVDENPADLKEYGLTSPRVQVEFQTEDGKKKGTLLIGEKSPSGNDLFAKEASGTRVFLIPSFQEAGFNRTTFDLRDKTVLDFDRTKVTSVEVVAGGKTMQLSKDSADWKLVKPVSAKADYGTAEGLVTRLQGAQAKSIASSDPSQADLRQFGFDKPTVTVNLISGDSRATLIVGEKTPDNAYFARDTSKKIVVAIEAGLVEELLKSADEYRNKELFELRPFSTNHIEITRDGQTSVYETKKGDPNKAAAWQRISPNPGDVNPDKFDSFLVKITYLRAAAFVESTAKTGLDKPVLIVKGKYNDGAKEDTVSFGRTATDDIYASRAGEPGAMKIETNDFNEALKALDEAAK